MEPGAKLYTDKLTIGYEKDLIGGIDLAILPGQIMTLIGPNGCGKSTLLKTLCAQLSSRGGLVYLDGADMGKLSATEIAKKLSIVMTAQIKPELMTCREMIETGRYPYTGMLGILSKIDHAAVDAAIEMTGTGELAGRYFDTLSDGQKQRVMLARAICQEPEILILDEPTSYLDIKYKLDILDKIKKLAKEKGIAVILSLHELEIAMRLSDTVVALGDGQIRRIGTPKEVFEESFIRSLFGIEGADMELGGALPWFAGASPVAEGVSAKQDGVAKERLEASCDGAEDGPRVLMVQGTMSGAGKSLLVAGLCRIFAQDGYRVAPFKSQNMALNSYITEEGLEMGRAQVVQAECCKVKPLSCMNPILLKPNDDKGSQVIVNGVPIGNMKADAYFSYRKELISEIMAAFSKLSEMADIIVVEGAGSPVELNLQENDIVNMGLARMLHAKVLLAGDIDRGGIFAQLLGTVSLLSQEDKARICGLIVNKFRGDVNLFTDGIRMLKEKSGKDVIGVVPYLDVRLDEEDSVTDRFAGKEIGAVDIAVIRLPHVSNFTDFECFTQVEDVSVRFVRRVEELGNPDLLILPGTKNTVADLQWLAKSGLDLEVQRLAKAGTSVIGICGGYQILGRNITDRSDRAQEESVQGLELLPVDTVIEQEKTRSLFAGMIVHAEGELAALAGKHAKGYEIHMGTTMPYEDLAEFTSHQTGYCRGNVYGTYVHGLFDQKEIYVTILETIAGKKGMTLHTSQALDQSAFKEAQYEKLAAHLREHLDMRKIYEILGIER